MLLSQYYRINMSILVLSIENSFLIDPASQFTSFLLTAFPSSCQKDSTWLKVGREILAIILKRQMYVQWCQSRNKLRAWEVLDLTNFYCFFMLDCS